jgi:hypothetical protein
MRIQMLLIFFCLTTGYCLAGDESDGVAPRVTDLLVDRASVAVLHLHAGYTTAVRLPEEVNSVVLGNPAQFRAEHSESEPRLVFLKPITLQPAESNALITTKSGQEINLHLVSAGKEAAHSPVDFFVEYKRQRSPILEVQTTNTFLIPETKSLIPERAEANPTATQGQILLGRQLALEKAVSTPAWKGTQFQGAVGESVEHDREMIVGFSVLNASKAPIEILPPQIVLRGNKGRKEIKAEPVAITDFRLAPRRLEPGARADGVVAFEKPAFKQSSEQLLLRLAVSDQVDRPIILPLPFTGTREGGTQ